MNEAWHIFKIRRALLTDQNLCFAVDGVPNFVIRLPELQRATASMLYVNAVALLDDAIETRLSPVELTTARTLGRRLKTLRDRGDLLNYEALDLIRFRRNEIGHELEKDATPEELDTACGAIQNQLAAWGLVLDEPPYILQWERSATRESSDPRVAFEQDRILRIMRGDSWVFESKTNVVVWRIGKSLSLDPQDPQ